MTNNKEKGRLRLSLRKGDFRSDRYNNNRPRRDYASQSESTNTQVVSAVFRELVHQVLEKIKNKPF